MRTKNRKRIGPVPISLVAALALAAFLSVGLLMVVGSQPQPVAAQDADCTIDATTLTTTPVECKSTNGMATIKFTGVAAAATDANAVTLHLMIRDDSGSLRLYKNGEVEYNTTDNQYEITFDGAEADLGTQGAPAPSPMRYRYQEVTVPGAKAVDGELEKNSVSVMVSGDVTIYKGALPGVGLRPKIDGGPDTDARRQLAPMHDAFVDVTLLGAPAIGKDSTNDRNKIVDDFKQCTVGEDTNDPAGTDLDGNMDDCRVAGDDVADEGDMPESLSKLDADGGVTTYADADASVLDGKTDEVTLTGTMVVESTAVVIRATIKDAKKQILEGVEVTFTATSVPAGIENRARSYDSSATGMAYHTIEGLPMDKPYRVTVVVTAGEDNPLTVGTIVIARAGDLDTITAEACATVMLGETDTKMDGCMTGYNPKMIYGPGDGFFIYAKATDSRGTKVMPDPFVVKPATAATWWDTLDCMEMNDAVMPMDDEPAVGSDDPMADPKSPYCAMYADLSAEAMPVVMRAFGKAYGDATDAFDITAAGKPVDDGMLMLTVEGNAPGAKYLLDVVGTAGPNNKMITKSDQVRVIVSGKVHEYKVEPEEQFVMPRRSAEFTVKALDENGNPPDFDTDKDIVKVVADYGIVRGSGYDRSNSELTLSTTTGEGKFTFVMPRDAQDGEEFVVLVGEGDMQVEVMVTVGMAVTPQPMLTAPTGVMAMSDAAGMVTVTWTPGTDAIGHLVFLFKSDFSGTPMMDTPSGDSHTFNDVPAGSYIAVVVSYRSASEYMYEAFLSAVAVQ